ncbi:zinc dependent phospholipase C family protein [Cellulosilyticum sp. I15G10I2]|uniref:zinc dependent phospholipase C family protein n=1 Tax=Cellulosilyticum sp. I15G10I2 TaxID=1892843 RepID=UPI00085C6412|nr:zinc dependent phospholipase C family protein [Cellulosilyticum sp. I15G10I2]
MPDIITHYLFGLDTTQNLKQSPIYKIIKENKNLFLIGLQGPDLMYYNTLPQKESKAYIGLKMHTDQTGDFLISALSHLKRYDINSQEFNESLSYLCGFMCHYILDSMAHPYIFYLGGRYEDTPDTAIYKTLHKKIELAIDSLLLEQKFGLKAHRFKIHQHILKNITIPYSILSIYDEALFLTYNINNGGNIFKKSYKDARNYFMFTYDTLGAKKLFAGAAFPLLPKNLSSLNVAFSYHNCVNSSIDYMNDGKQVWCHPVTGNIYTFSFNDILRNAMKKSTLLLQAAFDFTTSKLPAEEFKELLPNISYLTGLPTSDTRPMKYISPDYIRL